MTNEHELSRILKRIDGRGYKAYRDLRGSYDLDECELFVDHVQGDPFAAPSKLRLRVLRSDDEWPASLSDNRVRRIALEDWLARRVERALHRGSGRGRRGSGGSGTISIDAGGQEVLERTAAVVNADWLEVRIEVGLPASGRRILGAEAEQLLCDELPRFARRALREPDLDEASSFVDCVENQEHIRSGLAARGLVAFVADGAVLPRESGASDRPLRTGAVVPFASPESLRVELPLLRETTRDGVSRSTLVGMGIPRGVTLIVGGGYHGKSTLLRAVERGVYPHVPGDGREWVIADAGLVKVRAEDGRRVEQVDIHAFIGDLPQGRSTKAFDSDDASGSTSQAANIVEAIEAGATGLLLDEDTSATNFMVRDARMQALIHKEDEPITPFVERVRELYDRLSVSTVLVMGGSGDYLEAADRVIAMRDFVPNDVTERAKRIAEATPGARRADEARGALSVITDRIPEPTSFDASRGRRSVKIDARGVEQIRFGTVDIDLRGVDQLVDPSQTRAVGSALHLAAERYMDGERSLREVLDALDAQLDADGLDGLDPFHRPGRHPGRYARARRFEIAAAINRLRSLRMRQRR